MSSYNSSSVGSSPGPTKSEPPEGDAITSFEKSELSPSHLRPELQDGRDPDGEQAQPETQDGRGLYFEDGRGEDPERQRPLPSGRRKSWYRTTKGMIFIVVSAIVIIAAAIGGGVGGSRKKSGSGDNDPAPPGGDGSAGGSLSADGTMSVETSTATGDDPGDAGSTSTPIVPLSQGAGGDQTGPADTPTPTPTPTDSQPTPTQDPDTDSTQTPDFSTDGPPGDGLPPTTTNSVTDSSVTFDFTIHVPTGGFVTPIAPVAPPNTATFNKF